MIILVIEIQKRKISKSDRMIGYKPLSSNLTNWDNHLIFLPSSVYLPHSSHLVCSVMGD